MSCDGRSYAEIRAGRRGCCRGKYLPVSVLIISDVEGSCVISW